MTITVLGEGFLEVDLPARLRDPDAYRWDDIVALFHRTDSHGNDVEFPAKFAEQHGTLVAVVNREPRKLNPATHVIRRNAPIPQSGAELVLGTGTVRYRKRTINGSASDYHQTNAVGLDTPLDGDAVRSLMNQWVRLELRT